MFVVEHEILQSLVARLFYFVSAFFFWRNSHQTSAFSTYRDNNCFCYLCIVASDVVFDRFPIVEPDYGHTKLRLATQGLEAIQRITTPIAAVAVSLALSILF